VAFPRLRAFHHFGGTVKPAAAAEPHDTASHEPNGEPQPPLTHDPGDEPPVITVDELAELLRLDRKTVYSAIQQGEIPGVRRIGRAIRISREAVVVWLREGRASRSRRRP
jgi:excisionase family DNA binding protein